jgi:hypothetical protein
VATVATVANELVALLEEDARRDLAEEDAAIAIEVHFPPVEVVALPWRDLEGDACSTDGYYEAFLDPTTPRIVFADDVTPARARFTLLHELGHHLLATAGAHLLDDIDRIGGSSEGATRTEELVCHDFAGTLLVPDDLMAQVVGDGRLAPRHVRELKERTSASWEAVAVRASARIAGAGAVVLVREAGRVSFCSARGLEHSWWPRGSALDPNGPMFRALESGATARTDTYRWGLGYARSLFCDAAPIRDDLAVAVLSTRPSDGHFEILQDPDPVWKDHVQYCEWCNEERTDGWCDRCKGRYCGECGRCGCTKPRVNPVCTGCGLRKPFRQGASVCVDCEAD